MRLSAALVVLLFAAPFACGKKAAPIPPERLVPRPVRGLEARNVAEGFQLSWQAPVRRVNNNVIEGLRQFVVLRAEGETRERCSGPGTPWMRVGEVAADDFAANPDRRYVLVDRAVKVNRWYGYRVLAVDLNGGHSGAPAGEPVLFRGRPPEEAPAPRAGVGDGFVAIAMPRLFPDDVVAWSLYRKATDASEPDFPFFAGAVTVSEYTDGGLVNGVPHQYAAAWVRYAEGFPIEGPRSSWVTAAPQDLVPPRPSSSMVGVAVKGVVDLRWERVEELGVRYHVYRRPASEPGFERLTPEPVDVNTLVDRPPKGEYVYAVSSVDTVGNESPRGAETTVTVR